MNIALALTIIAFVLFTVAIAVTACAIVMGLARRRESYTVKAAIRYLEQRKTEKWEAET